MIGFLIVSISINSVFISKSFCVLYSLNQTRSIPLKLARSKNPSQQCNLDFKPKTGSSLAYLDSVEKPTVCSLPTFSNPSRIQVILSLALVFVCPTVGGRVARRRLVSLNTYPFVVAACNFV